MWKRLDDLDAALDQHVGPAAVIPGNAADQDAEAEADDYPDQADGQRDPSAVDHAGQQIPAEPIGPEQEQVTILGRANKVKITGDQSPIVIFVAAAKEPDRLALGQVRRIHPPQIGHVEPILVTVDEWPSQPAVIK